MCPSHVPCIDNEISKEKQNLKRFYGASITSLQRLPFLEASIYTPPIPPSRHPAITPLLFFFSHLLHAIPSSCKRYMACKNCLETILVGGGEGRSLSERWLPKSKRGALRHYKTPLKTLTPSFYTFDKP